MDTWLPPIISGIFSVAVVAIGAWLVNAREERTWKRQLEKEHLQEQRQAIGSYVQTISEALRDWRIGLESTQKPGKTAEEEHWLTVSRMESIHQCYVAIQDAGTRAVLEIQEPNTLKALTALHDSFIDEHNEFIKAAGPYNNPHPKAIWSQTPGSEDSYKKMAHLVVAARKHLHP